MPIQIQLRRGTQTEWSNANPVLAQGEVGLETNSRRFKVGDGVTNWNSLEYGGLEGPRKSNYINLVMEGAIAPPVNGLSRFYPPVAVVLTKVYASIALTTVNAAFSFRLKKNGVNTGLSLLIPAGSYVMTPVDCEITVQPTDYLTLDVISTEPSRNLHVKIDFTDAEFYNP
jgi:hypothetical protein